MTDPTGQTTYTYDSAGRVTAVSSPRGQITYTYDSAGRRAPRWVAPLNSLTFAGSIYLSPSPRTASLRGAVLRAGVVQFRS
jgi:YD repeat-containing protein